MRGLTEKLIEAGTRILAMATGLPQSDCRTAMESATHRAIREHGLRRLPSTEDPLELRYAMVERTLEILKAELPKRGVAKAKIDQACTEMLTLYESIRPRDEAQVKKGAAE